MLASHPRMTRTAQPAYAAAFARRKDVRFIFFRTISLCTRLEAASFLPA